MAAGRDIEGEVISALDRRGIPYRIIEIDPAFADTADFCREYGYTLDVCGNTIVVASRREPRQFAACVLLGSDRLDVNRTVKTLMGVSKVSFASPEDTVALTGMAVGGVTPLALPPDLPVYADEKLLTVDYVILGSGSRKSKITVEPQELKKLPALQFVPGLSMTTSPP